MSRGVLYVVSGSRYIEEAITSAESLKRQNPQLSVAIYTDTDVNSSVFDNVVELDEPIENPGDSILSRQHFPYDRNLYLDADTFVCTDISDVFEVLDWGDLAMAQNTARCEFNRETYDAVGTDPPSAFTEYNSGVIAYNDCETVRELFDAWHDWYEVTDSQFNQPALRYALYDSDVNLVTLPPEYNYMTHRVGYAYGPVRILHGRSEVQLPQFAEIINRYDEYRVTTWENYPVRVVPDSHQARRYRAEHLINLAVQKWRRDGTLALLKAVRRKLL